MDDEEILDCVECRISDWTDEQISTFMRRALTEDITEEDLMEELGLPKRGK